MNKYGSKQFRFDRLHANIIYNLKVSIWHDSLSFAMMLLRQNFVVTYLYPTLDKFILSYSCVATHSECVL